MWSLKMILDKKSGLKLWKRISGGVYELFEGCGWEGLIVSGDRLIMIEGG